MTDTKSTGKQILVVEDDGVIANRLQSVLTKMGYTVPAAVASGEEAIQQALEARPDLVLMDVRLTGELDGIETARQIRAHLDLPVVYLTAYADDNLLQRAKITEPYNYIVKPIRDKELYAAVEMALHRHRLEARLKEDERRMDETLQQVEQAKQEWENTADSLPELVCLVDSQGCILRANRTLEHWNLGTVKEIKGQKIGELFHPAWADFWEQAWASLAQGRPIEREVEDERLRRHLHVQVQPILPQSSWRSRIETSFAAVVIQDITERVQVEKELTRYREHLEELVNERTAQLIKAVNETRQLNEQLRREVAERRQAEETARRERDFAESLIDTAQAIVLLLDPAGRIIRFNPYMEGLSGFRLEEVRGKDWFATFLPKRDHEHIRGVFAKAVSDIQTRGNVNPILTRDGRERQIEWYDKTLKDADGNVIGVLAIGHDITERLRAEKEIRQRTAQLEALRQMGLELTAELDLDSLLHSVVSRAVDLLGGIGGYLYLYRPESDTLEQRTSIEPQPGPEEVILKRGEGLSGKVLECGCSLVVDDYRHWEGRAEVYEGHPVTAVVGTPIRWGPAGADEEFLGVLNVRADEPGAFSQADAELLEMFATQAAIAIKNARLMEEAKRHARQLAALNKAGEVINSVLDLDLILQMVISEVRELLDVEGASVLLHGPVLAGAEDELVFAAAAGLNAETLVGARMPATAGIAGAALQEKQVVIVNDARNDPRFYDQVDARTGMTTRSLLAVPLMSKGKAVGVIEVVNRINGAFDENDLEVLQAVASSATIAIENARLFAHLEEALRQEETARVQLVQAGKLSAMGRMVASVAHELNNPLQTIKNCLFLVQQELPSQAQSQEFVGMALSEIRRLSDLVTQLRTVYRPSSPDQMRHLDLSKILEEVHVLIAPHLKENGIQWEYTPSPAPVVVNGIADQLKQVFLNLSLNAVDAMKTNGGTLAVSLLTTDDGSQVGVAFKDTGLGIKSEDLPHLFDPLFTTKEGGTGLGLAISYDIVLRHSGQIEVESQPALGATFTVWLPVERDT